MPITTANRQPIPDTYETFIEGEIVSLVSGGPDMTVLDYCDDCDTVEVAWFNGDALEIYSLPAAVLVSA